MPLIKGKPKKSRYDSGIFYLSNFYTFKTKD